MRRGLGPKDTAGSQRSHRSRSAEKLCLRRLTGLGRGADSVRETEGLSREAAPSALRWRVRFTSARLLVGTQGPAKSPAAARLPSRPLRAHSETTPARVIGPGSLRLCPQPPARIRRPRRPFLSSGHPDRLASRSRGEMAYCRFGLCALSGAEPPTHTRRKIQPSPSGVESQRGATINGPGGP